VGEAIVLRLQHSVAVILEYMVETFCEDPEVLERVPTNRTVENCVDFMHESLEICKEKQMTLYTIFDQHNELPAALRGVFPFALYKFFSYNKSADVVVCITTSNDYYVKNDGWPTWRITEGFSESEALAFLSHQRFFTIFDCNKVSPA